MKNKGMFSIIGMLIVLSNVVFTACSSKKNVYIKEDITLKFKNESGITCYIAISGCSNPESQVFGNVEQWQENIYFPSVSKTQIPIGGERTITIKDVVVSGKNSGRTMMYNQNFNIIAFGDDPTRYKEEDKSFYSSSESQYTGGTFYIKLKEVDPREHIFKFDIDFIN